MVRENFLQKPFMYTLCVLRKISKFYFIVIITVMITLVKGTNAKTCKIFSASI